MRVNAFAMLRARHALDAAGLDPEVPLERTSSVTNEVWLGPDVVVRVNSKLDHRLRREADLARILPAAVRYPRVIAYGGEIGADWLILERVPGRPLSRCWPDLDLDQRRAAIAELAVMLRAVHQTKILERNEVREAPQLLDRARTGREAVARLLDALAELATFDHVDARIIEHLAQLVRETAHFLDPFDVPTLVHGDLTFENMLWDGEHVTALLDFEWARTGPPDLDLDILLRFVAYPQLHVAEDYEDRTHAADYAEVPWWLAEDYPELFEIPNELERMRIYGIAWDVKEMLQFPPRAELHHLPEAHPYHRLVRTLRGVGYLDELNGDVSITF